MVILPPLSLEAEWRSQSPADRFVKAIVSGDFLQYCDTPAREDDFYNLKLILHVREIPGKIEGIFQDPPTFELHLRSEPLRYMQVVEVILAAIRNKSWNWVVLVVLGTGFARPLRFARGCCGA
ncbi:hypothetical protein BD413DRAFT_618198 [Trametes elegans]|nr:hypothetical protein BD413DRAFT_618198 [Trametes elegans]